MKVTLQDLSNETGYSLSTVSRVLNGSDKYSEDTRKTIIDAARRLQYNLNRVRQTDFPKSHHNIALITDFHEGEFYSSYFYGYVRATANSNIRISLISLNDPREMIKDYIGLFSDQYYDGAIIFIPALVREDYEVIAKDIPEGFPVVSNALIESPILNTITFDGYSAGHMAAEHFYKLGHKKVGIVKGPLTKAESRFRYNGFVDYVNQSPDMNLVFETPGNFNYDAGVAAFHSYMESYDRPTAIFISNDLMSQGFNETAKDHNISIPQDVALLGYDDLPMCMHSRPQLSSIKTNFETLAKASLESIFDAKSNSKRSHGLLSLIPVSLIARQSTVPAK
jgi:DNA-binding LacI/PurR family transcriptional regulator